MTGQNYPQQHGSQGIPPPSQQNFYTYQQQHLRNDYPHNVQPVTHQQAQQQMQGHFMLNTNPQYQQPILQPFVSQSMQPMFIIQNGVPVPATQTQYVHTGHYDSLGNPLYIQQQVNIVQPIQPINYPVEERKPKRTQATHPYKVTKIETKRQKLADQGILALRTGHTVSVVVPGNITGISLFLAKPIAKKADTPTCRDTGLQFLDGQPSHNLDKVSQLNSSTNANSLFQVTDIHHNQNNNTTSFKFQLNISPYSGSWKVKYKFYKLLLYGATIQDSFVSQCIQVAAEFKGQSDSTDLKSDDDTSILFERTTNMTALALQPDNGNYPQPCDIIFGTESVISPAVFWRDSWTVKFGYADANVRQIGVIDNNNREILEYVIPPDTKNRIRVTVEVPVKKYETECVPVETSFNYGIMTSDKWFTYTNEKTPQHQVSQTMETKKPFMDNIDFEVFLNSVSDDRTSLLDIYQNNNGYSFMNDFVNKTRNAYSRTGNVMSDEEPVVVAFTEAARAFVTHLDAFGRNICFYIATHPSCTPRVREILFQEVGYDRAAVDIYGYNCDEWLSMIEESYLNREFEGMLDKLDTKQETEQDESWKSYTEEEYRNELTNGLVASQTKRYGNGSLLAQGVNTWHTEYHDSTPVRILLKCRGQSEVLRNPGSKSVHHGSFTVAINIGETALEWTEQGLVHTYKAEGDRAIVDLEIGNIKKKDWANQVQKIANLATMWNGKKQFSPKNNNSMHFVRACCQSLNISLKVVGQLGQAFAEIERDGYASAALRVTETLAKQLGADLLKEYGMENNRIVFNSHAKLDDFVVDVRKVNQSMLQDEQTNQYLKGIDRMFHHRTEYESDYDSSVCDRSKKHDCPYGDTRGNPLSGWGKTSRQPKNKDGR